MRGGLFSHSRTATVAFLDVARLPPNADGGNGPPGKRRRGRWPLYESLDPGLDGTCGARSIGIDTRLMHRSVVRIDRHVVQETIRGVNTSRDSGAIVIDAYVVSGRRRVRLRYRAR